MNQAEIETFINQLANVQQEENFGYAFFFVGDDHRLPFVSIADADNDFDNVSNLNRVGVFRVNISVSKATFQNLVGESSGESVDYALLNVFLPHPHYARQHFVCILNPAGENDELTRQLILEAHSLAEARLQRKGSAG